MRPSRRAFLLTSASASVLAGCYAFERLPIRAPDAPYIVSRDAIVNAMLELAEVRATDVVYDLGSGDGRIPIAAARLYGAHGVGVDIDNALVQLARKNAAAAGVADRVEFRLEDLFKTDVRPATVVTLYLLPEMLERLKFSLREQLRDGARIVSHKFGWGGDWPPDRTIDVAGTPVHLWIVRK